MKQINQISFFGYSGFPNSKEHIWKVFSQNVYEVMYFPIKNDIIEIKWDCQYLNQGVWKPISLELGENKLYSRSVHNGYLSLNFTTITQNIQEGQIIFRFSKNGGNFEIKVEDQEKIKGFLVRRCVQTTFHEDFIIQKIIANGNKKAMVFQVQRKSNNQKLAVKGYNKDFVSQFPRGRQSLKNEIKGLRMLDSSHIVKLYEVHETGNSIYLIMDLIEGGKLSDIIYGQNIKQIVYNVLQTLNQIHQKNLISRNISPENILLKDEDSDIVIVDFGEVQFKGKSQYQPFRTSGFMAPELFENKTIDEKCDIYSVGVIFYCLVVQNIGDLHKTTKPIYCNLEAKKFKQAPKAQQSIIKKMLRIDPKTRYSAEKCLQHRYFETIMDPKQKVKQFEDQMASINIGNEGFGSNSQKELSCSQNSVSEQSMSSKSAEEISNYKIDKKLPVNYSKFSKFCQEMAEFQANSPKSRKKGIEESLFKIAVKNSYLKQESKDDNYNTPKPNVQRGGFLKKSNSLNV